MSTLTVIVIICLIIYGIYSLISAIVEFIKDHPFISASIVLGIAYIKGIFVANDYGKLDDYFRITLIVLAIAAAIVVVVCIIVAVIKLILRIIIHVNTSKVYKLISQINTSIESFGPCYNYDNLRRTMFLAYGNKQYETEYGYVETNTLISYVIANYVKRNVNTIACYVEKYVNLLVYVVDFNSFCQIVEKRFGNYCTGELRISTICNDVLNDITENNNGIRILKGATDEQKRASPIVNPKPAPIILSDDDDDDDDLSPIESLKTAPIILGDDDDNVSGELYDDIPSNLINMVNNTISMYQDG